MKYAIIQQKGGNKKMKRFMFITVVAAVVVGLAVHTRDPVMAGIATIAVLMAVMIACLVFRELY